MVVMMLKRCQNRLTGSEMPTAAFTKVTHLELSSLNVSLNQAVELTTQNLVMLDMSHSTGLSVPQNFGEDTRAKELKHLYLSNCSLTELPESLGKMPSLVTLDIASNKLSRLPALLPSTLEGLYVSENQLTSLPVSLQSLSSMRMLDVTSNHNLRSLPPLLGAERTRPADREDSGDGEADGGRPCGATSSLPPLTGRKRRPQDGSKKAKELALPHGEVHHAMEILGHENQVKAAMQFVFGGALVCDSPETAKLVTFHPQVRPEAG